MVRSIIGALAAAVITASAIVGCALPTPASAAARTDGTMSTPTFTPLPTSGIPDYQLGGAYRPPTGVTIVERDSTSHPAPGAYNICYINGFQTQPQDARFWKREHPSVILRRGGTPISDPGWPGEMILDTRTSASRTVIAKVLDTSIARCAARGFQAVEFDNLDSWTRSHGMLTRADNVAMATLLVRASHARGLAAGQKNTTQLGSAGARQVGFDFAVAEECMRYHECAAYTRVYGPRVIDIEYASKPIANWSSRCGTGGMPVMTIVRDRDLVPAGRRGYVFQHC